MKFIEGKRYKVIEDIIYCGLDDAEGFEVEMLKDGFNFNGREFFIKKETIITFISESITSADTFKIGNNEYDFCYLENNCLKEVD